MSDNKEFDLIIEPGKGSKKYWTDLWAYKELFLFLAWRDILVRYKQTVIGISWSVIRPLLTMVIFTFVFGKIAKLPSDGVPYPILVFSALLPWQFFSTAFSEASQSLVSNSNLLTKVYFPRLIVPTSSVLVNLTDFLISFILLTFIMIWFQFEPSLNILFVPFFLFLAIVTALGSGYLIAALNVKYRDFKHIIPFVVQFGLYVSPVFTRFFLKISRGSSTVERSAVVL